MILAIESSCDDTSAAVMRDGVLLSNVTASQAVHEAYGGVVPELASRAHQQNIVPVVDQALKKAGVKLYYLCCGTSDFLWENSVKLDATLTECGLDHEFFKSDGGHVWANWRLYLNNLAPKLFK